MCLGYSYFSRLSYLQYVGGVCVQLMHSGLTIDRIHLYLFFLSAICNQKYLPLLQLTYFPIITMTSQWAQWRLKSPTSPLFTQPFIRAQIKEISKLRVTGLCAGNSSGTCEFPAQMASNAENVSI